MPVIGVDEIGNPAPLWLPGQSGGDVIEKRKAKRIVRPFFSGFGLVKPSRPAVESRAIDQPHRNIGLRKMSFKEPNLAATQRVAERKRVLRLGGLRDRLRVTGNEQSHVDSEFPQGCGQRGRYVG